MAILGLGIFLTVLATSAATLILLGGYAVPALIWATLPFGLVLSAIGWLLLRTIEMRLWSCFTGLIGALALQTSIGAPGLQTLSARLGTGALDLTMVERTSAASIWALVAALALILVAIWINRRA